MAEVVRHCDQQDELHQKVTDRIAPREEGHEHDDDRVGEEAEDEGDAQVEQGHLPELTHRLRVTYVDVQVVEEVEAHRNREDVANEGHNLQILVDDLVAVFVGRAHELPRCQHCEVVVVVIHHHAAVTDLEE